jgi:AraC-like DNA-binding protein
MALPLSNYGTRGHMMLFNDPVMHLNARQAERCKENMEYVRTRCAEKEHRFYLDLTLNAVQAMIIDFFDFHAEIYAESNDLTHQNAHLMNRFLEMLERGDYRSHRDIAYYADQLCVTPKYLSRLLRETLDCKPSDIISLYTEKAIEYRLRFTDMTMQQIADDLKFANPSFFGKYVKEHLGMTPLEYRMKYQREQE